MLFYVQNNAQNIWRFGDYLLFLHFVIVIHHCFMKHVQLFFVSLLLLLTGTLSILANEVKVPKWEKFVSAKNGNANLRREPNVKSPRLYIHHQFRFHEFSWQGDGRNTPYSLTKETIVPVIEERNGWLLVYIETTAERV